jgi:glycosyltransferase involved in cell wall biosynthesis
MESKVSICIPTYEMVGFGEDYLNYSLAVIAQQDYSNIEVVVSDHSKNNTIEELCNSYSEHVDVVYVRNSNSIGNSSANLNNAVAHASGDILRILFQDDFLLSSTSIKTQLASLLSSPQKWNVTACAHTYDGETIIDSYYPQYHSNILFQNTISSPSVLMVYKKYYQPFDEKLLWYMDTDVYHRLGQLHGPPSICNHITVVNRRHEHQITNTRVNDEVIERETTYLKNKHGV